MHPNQVKDGLKKLGSCIIKPFCTGNSALTTKQGSTALKK